mgnify:CR=1 FL=1
MSLPVPGHLADSDRRQKHRRPALRRGHRDGHPAHLHRSTHPGRRQRLSGCLDSRGRTVAAGQLRRLLPDHACEPLNVHALLPARQFVPAKVRCFLDAMEAHARGDPEAYIRP